ncbi:MAG: TetR family transcriptional regulator [Demequinaceae bacterium]|nr:TetR family transcriptional regulator [Demequinaceae bacterium]
MLTPDLIFERALAIVDAEGLEALSMRCLASDLGVEAASLYHHIADKQALLDGVIGRARSEMVVTADPMGEWMPFLEEVFVEYRRMLVAHPNLLDLAGWRLENNMEDGLAYLVGIGFTLDDAVEMMQSLVALAVGFAMFSVPRVPKGERGLTPEMSARMGDWREETCTRMAHLNLESFEGRWQT